MKTLLLQGKQVENWPYYFKKQTDEKQLKNKMTTMQVKSRVIWTYVIGVLVILAYIGMSVQAGSTTIPDNIIIKYGAPYAKDIYDGAIWGVVLNSFLHNNLTLFVCNIAFFIIAGYLVEKRNGPIFLLFFGLGGSILTSCAELAISGDPGVGLTGVNFGLLGYLLISGKIKWRNPWLRALPWFFIGVVLFLCAEQIIQNDYKTAVFSILAGLLFGITVAFTQRYNWLFYSLQFVFFGISFLSLVYNPYSSEWHNVKGYHLLNQGETVKAKHHFKQALKIYPENVAAQDNMRIIRLEKLIDEAYQFHLNKDYPSARNIYIQILKIDENNAWAKENLAELP